MEAWGRTVASALTVLPEADAMAWPSPCLLEHYQSLAYH